MALAWTARLRGHRLQRHWEERSHQMDRIFRTVRILGTATSTILITVAVAIGQGMAPSSAIHRVYYYCSVHHQVDPRYMPRAANPDVRPLRHSPQLKQVIRDVDRQLASAGRDYEKILVRLENELAEKPEHSVRLFRLGYAFAQAG